MNPKFENFVKSQANTASQQQAASRYGIIQSYNSLTNTAVVLLPSQDSDTVGEVLRDVPCPVTMGIKMADPEPGRPCWVALRRGQSTRGAVITSYFHHNFGEYDALKMSNMRSGIPLFTSRM